MKLVRSVLAYILSFIPFHHKLFGSHCSRSTPAVKVVKFGKLRRSSAPLRNYFVSHEYIYLRYLTAPNTMA